MDTSALYRAAAVLTAIGGINWGLVGIFEFDLVAWIFGEEFGTTNAATRIIYILVGLAALYVLARALMPARRHDHTRADRSPAGTAPRV